MKRTTSVVVVLVASAALGAATGTALALWDDDETITASVGIGHVHYAVGDPASPLAPLRGEGTFTDGSGAPGWVLPAGVLTNLAPGAPQSAVVQVDGYSQGNRGLEYWLSGLTISGDAGFVAAADLRVAAVDDPADCVAGALAARPALYAGPAPAASFGDRELVGPRQFHEPDYGTWQEDSVTEYLCLELALPDGAPTYTNTVTATGTGKEGSADVEVSAVDDWSAIIAPTAAQRAARVTLTFPYDTYRPGGQDAAGSSGGRP